MRQHDVRLVLDIGANSGQYATELRSAGYQGRIVSFEPLIAPFQALERASRADATWDCHQVALGKADGREEMNVAANNGASSSLLPMEEWIATAMPSQAYVGAETVRVARLDEMASNILPGLPESVMLKIDVQGLELEVLEGGRRTLDQALLVETELSFVPLYAGQPLWRDILDYLGDAGFEVIGLEPIFFNPDGRLLQVDATLARSKRENSPGR